MEWRRFLANSFSALLKTNIFYSSVCIFFSFIRFFFFISTDYGSSCRRRFISTHQSAQNWAMHITSASLQLSVFNNFFFFIPIFIYSFLCTKCLPPLTLSRQSRTECRFVLIQNRKWKKNYTEKYKNANYNVIGFGAEHVCMQFRNIMRERGNEREAQLIFIFISRDSMDRTYKMSINCGIISVCRGIYFFFGSFYSFFFVR